MIDNSGKPRSEKDILDAIQTVNKMFLKPGALPAELFVMLPTIRESLQELLKLREELKK